MKPRVVFISGYLCSGKSQFIKTTFRWMYGNVYKQIIVSSIVKEIIGKSTRSELQDTEHLDVTIAGQIMNMIDYGPYSYIVIDGIRQPSIFKHIESYLQDSGISYQCIWLSVPIGECERRFLAKNDGKENISFEQAFENDKKLGLLELEQLWKQNNCTVINNE